MLGSWESKVWNRIWVASTEEVGDAKVQQDKSTAAAFHQVDSARDCGRDILSEFHTDAPRPGNSIVVLHTLLPVGARKVSIVQATNQNSPRRFGKLCWIRMLSQEHSQVLLTPTPMTRLRV